MPCCGHFQSEAERSRATITLQRLHLILLLAAAHRTGVINSPRPPPFRNIRVPKLAAEKDLPVARLLIPADKRFDQLIVTGSSLSEVVNLFCLISRQIKSFELKLKGGAEVADVSLVF